jgi:hypothetical protein
MSRYALIKDTIVENIIVADLTFISNIENDWDFCIDLASFNPEPCIGWIYDELTLTFTDPTPPPEEPPPEEPPP